MIDMKCRVWNGEKMVYLPTLIVDDFSIGFTTKDEFYVDINNHYPTPGLVVTWFTGLKDKNGVEIYEGDTLQTPKGKGKITWEEGRFWFECEDKWPYSIISTRADTGKYDIATDDSEVIGNIYENPELIK